MAVTEETLGLLNVTLDAVWLNMTHATLTVSKYVAWVQLPCRCGC